MLIKQISVFVENKFGRVAKIIELLSEKNINISALSIADTTDFGILRLIVDKSDEAVEVLKESGVIAKCTDVIAVAIDDQPGGLSAVLKIVSDAGVGIEYMYAFLGRKLGKALMVLKADDEQAAVNVLKEHNVEIVIQSEI